MRTEFLCISVLRVASGPRVTLAGCESALSSPASPTPPVVYSIDRSKAMVSVLVFLSVLCGLFYEAICFILSLVLCFFFVLVFVSPFIIAITSLGEEIANLSVYRTFVLVWFCLFSLPLGVLEGLRLVIVALHGLFSYLFVFLKC